MIRKKVAIGQEVSLTKLIQAMENFSVKVVEHAIHNMVRNGDLKEMKGRKVLHREK